MSVSNNCRQEYVENGFTVIREILNTDELKKVQLAYEDFLVNEAPLLSGRDINYADKEKKIVNSIHKLHGNSGGFFANLMDSEKMREIAGTFLIGKAKGRGSEMFAKPAQKGMPSPAHQDNFYWCLKPVAPGTALTIWIALDNCGPENGGVTYLKGSHKMGILDHLDSYAPGSSQTIANKSLVNEMPAICIQLKPGDALVHDSMTVHFSGANTSGQSRRGMTFQYQADNAKIDKNMLTHYETQLANQVKARAEKALSETN